MNGGKRFSRPRSSFSPHSLHLQQPCGDALCVVFFCFLFFQREAERAASGETEVGGEDHGPVQSFGAQHATTTRQDQVMYIYLDTGFCNMNPN